MPVIILITANSSSTNRKLYFRWHNLISALGNLSSYGARGTINSNPPKKRSRTIYFSTVKFVLSYNIHPCVVLRIQVYFSCRFLYSPSLSLSIGSLSLSSCWPSRSFLARLSRVSLPHGKKEERWEKMRRRVRVDILRHCISMLEGERFFTYKVKIRMHRCFFIQLYPMASAR